MTRSATAYWSDRRRARLACRPRACRPVVEGFARAGFLVLLAGAVAGPALAQPTEVGKIADSGLLTGDGYGQAVAIGGGLAVAGAPFEDGFFLNTGAAYVYREIAGTWALETPLAVTTGQSKDDWFGAAVATDGQIVAVGAPKFDTSFIDDGAVYVYRFSLTTGWSLEQKLTAPDPGTGDQFGAAVAIVGDALLIGAPFDDGKGSAYVFRYDGVSSWGFEGKMQSATASAGAQFGASLDGVGGRALIGAPLQSGGGKVWVFDQVGSVWTESTAFTSSDNAGDDQFGSSIAFDGAKALIGAHLDDQLDGLGANIPNAGAAYVFEWDGAAWIEEAKLTAGTDASGQANFGFSGDLAGGTAVVGAFQAHTTADQFTGAAYVFRFSGTAWARESVIVASDAAAGAGDLFGYDIDGIDTVMIGAPGDEPINTTKSASGSAYFFTLGAGPDLDSDGDGLTDIDETTIHGTNPFDKDTDDDLLDDGEEIDIAAFGGCPDPLAFDSDFDGLGDGEESLLGMDPCDADADNDGLADGLELDFGTDPFVADTDADGLLDGTEVDMAQGTGCPDPLNPDSDADTLTDGEEATLGTSPCSTDTDGDGVDDAVDDQPTVPGVSSGFIADALRDLAALVRHMPSDSFTGPTHNGHHGRRAELTSRLRELAKDAKKAEWEDIHRAITRRLLPRLDGNPRPSDWMVAGPDRDTVYAELVLIDSLVQYQSTVDHDHDHDGHRDHEDRDCDDD